MSSFTVSNSLPDCVVNIKTNISGQYIVAVVSSDWSIWYSNNYGVTFIQSSSFAELSQSSAYGYYNAITCDTTGQYWIVVGGGGVLYSNNYGATWTVKNISTDYISVVGNSNFSLLLATNGTQVNYSTDSGTTWTLRDSFGCTNLAGSGSLEYIAAIGNDSVLYVSSDYGFTFIEQINAIPLSGFVSACISNDGTKIYAVQGQDYANMVYSTNSGTTWTPISLDGWTYNVYCSDNGSVAVVDNAFGDIDGLGLYYTTNSGSTWTSKFANNAAEDNWNCSSVSGNGSYITSGTYGNGLNSGRNVYTFSPSVVCFLEGSTILTDKGYIKIEDLKKDDLVKTITKGFVPIFEIGSSEIDNPASCDRIKDQLYTLTPEKYPELSEKLVLTGCHSVLVNLLPAEIIEPTRELLGNIFHTETKYRLPICLDERSEIFPTRGKFTIYHICLEHESDVKNYGIYANGGLLVESCSKKHIKKLKIN